MGEQVAKRDAVLPAPAKVREVVGQRCVDVHVAALHHEHDGQRGCHDFGDRREVEEGRWGHANRVNPALDAARSCPVCGPRLVLSGPVVVELTPPVRPLEYDCAV